MAFDENNPKYKHGLFHVRTMIVVIVAVQMMCFWYELINFSVIRNNSHQNLPTSNGPIYRKNRNFSIINHNSDSELSKNSSVIPSDVSTSKIKEYDKFCAGAWNPVRGPQFPNIVTILYDSTMLLFCILVINAVRLTVPKFIIPKLACDFIAAYTSCFALGKMLVDPFLGSTTAPFRMDNFWYMVTLNCWCTVVNSYIFHISLNCYKYLNEKKRFFEQTALDIIAAAVIASNNGQQQNQAENDTAVGGEIFVDLPPAYPGLVAQENARAVVDDSCLPSYEEVERLASAQVKPV